MKDILIALVCSIQDSGGLIEYKDGLFAPASDPTNKDLGKVVSDASDKLSEIGVGIRLFIDESDLNSSEVE